MARLTLEALRKEYDRGRVVTVEDLSLDVEDGKFITVVDPSGCGKSTTLRMATGFESPSDGTIRINGEDVTDQRAHRRDMAMVFQNYALYPRKTVMQNIAFGLRVSTGLSKDERRKCVRETTAMMGIEDLLGGKPDELSGRQKQRVALGRATVREPDVFLFDEPLSNLDAKLRATMRTEIQHLQNGLGITSLYVTHDQREAITMDDKIVILSDGKFQQVGRPRDVYENPTNEFVGGFISSLSINSLDVSVEYESDRLILADDSPFSCRPSESLSATLREAADATDLRVGVYPGDAVTASSGENVVDSTVGVIEPIGSDDYLHLDISPNFTARVDSNVEPETGETVGITFDKSGLHIFHPQTGESLLSRESKQRAAPMRQA